MTYLRCRLPVIRLWTALALVSLCCACTAQPPESQPTTPSAVTYYTYEVVDAFPHDPEAFTQGLAFEDGFLYEGTGLKGRSSLRRVELETGVVLESETLPDDLFGEGVALVEDRIVQLTWKAETGLVYRKSDLAMVDEFSYQTEGWGITYDGQRLIMSDGTARLYFLDPDTFTATGSIDVHDRGTGVTALNELEFIDGLVYANVWHTDTIAIIDPADGRVTGWINLSGLLESHPVAGRVDVLNGIAWDAADHRLFVTGKLWPWLFEIRLVQDGPSAR